MLSSPENGQHPSKAFTVKAVGANDAKPQGAIATGRAAMQDWRGPRAWQSLKMGNRGTRESRLSAQGQHRSGCDRSTTSRSQPQAMAAGSIKLNIANPVICPASQAKRGHEGSGSLSAFIVAIESWRTPDERSQLVVKGGTCWQEPKLGNTLPITLRRGDCENKGGG